MKNFKILMLAKFSLVGVITAVVYFAVMWILCSMLGITHYLSISIAYLVSTLIHFQASRHFSFNASDNDYKNQIKRYMIMLLVNYLITILVVNFSINMLNFSLYAGVFLSTVITTYIGFTLGRNWVFVIKKEVV